MNPTLMTGLRLSIGVILAIASGCPSSAPSTSEPEAGTVAQSEQAQYRGPLLSNAIHMLNNLDQFDEQPASEQIIDRLNQWARVQEVAVTWTPDPLIATLPKPLQSGPWLERLEDKTFDRDLDADFLKEATWLRDVSLTARGDKLDELAIAERLFDWTVRNVELVEPPKVDKTKLLDLVELHRLLRRTPADLLLFGRGTATQRAWVFILLGRQQGLDIVMLAVPEPDHPDKSRPWLPALVHDGQLYLFDTSLGLPIPGPSGKGIATLKQAAEDESVLNQLDLDENHHYPIKAVEAKEVRAFVDGTPGYLSRRMKALESQLAGTDRVVLAASPEQIAGRLKGIAHVAPEIKLWTLPFETFALRNTEQTAAKAFRDALGDRLAMALAPYKIPGYRGKNYVNVNPGERQRAFDELIVQGEFALAADPENPNQPKLKLATDIKRPARVVFPLWAGRLLHLRGLNGGETGAKHFYMLGRPGDDQFGEYLAELRNDFVEANKEELPPRLLAKFGDALLRRKQDSTYWLGLISFDEKEYPTAEDYFRKLTLDVWANGPWSDGARYNLGRTYEASGRIAEAIKLYESSEDEKSSPQHYGNRLRARRLKEGTKPEAEKTKS